MAVHIDRKTGLITLHTLHSSYQMKADGQGTLLHTWYGGRIGDGDDLSSQLCLLDRGFCGNPYELGKKDKRYSLDLLPQEYGCFGTGDYRTAALKVRDASGACAVQLRTASCRREEGKYALEGLPAVYAGEGEAESLFVTLTDPATGLEVELQYGVLPELDAVTRAARITNRGTAPLTLEKAASACLDFPFGPFEWMTFHGRHAMERLPDRRPLCHGLQSVGSLRGASSHQENPFSILCAPGASETAGECWGFSLLYSGEFLMEAELDQADQTRLICGIHPENFSWTLGPGESFQTPELLMVYSGAGLERLSQLLHRIIREHICRGPWRDVRRPVLLNNWEATYFDFTGEKLTAIAKEAAELGVELFVLDDGWFGTRSGENSGLGDWTANEEKLGCSLRELGERITALGLRFGLWFEPEGLSEDSDLYRAHPEWAVLVPGRLPCLSRDQLILDFSRGDVQDYIIQCMSAILEHAPVSYIKWDMNRSICDKHSAALPPERQGEFAHRYVLGLYRVLETLHAAFPQVLFEGCSGGGGRFDAGMLYYTPQIWCSDNTDAVNRLQIQYGTSFGYPVSAVGAHVSAVPNHQTGRVTPFATRAAVAMAGSFGYELDPGKLTEEEREAVRRQIAAFKEDWPLLHRGDYYRILPPEAGCAVWEFAAPDGSGALLQAVYTRLEANPVPVHVRLRGLREEKSYRVTPEFDGTFREDNAYGWLPEVRVLSGAALMRAGLTLPPAWTEYQSFRIRIQEKK